MTDVKNEIYPVLLQNQLVSGLHCFTVKSVLSRFTRILCGEKLQPKMCHVEKNYKYDVWGCNIFNQFQRAANNESGSNQTSLREVYVPIFSRKERKDFANIVMVCDNIFWKRMERYCKYCYQYLSILIVCPNIFWKGKEGYCKQCYQYLPISSVCPNIFRKGRILQILLLILANIKCMPQYFQERKDIANIVINTCQY